MIALKNKINHQLIDKYKKFVFGDDKDKGQLDLKNKLRKILGKDETDTKKKQVKEKVARNKYQKLVDVYNILLDGDNLERILLDENINFPYSSPIQKLNDFEIDFRYKPLFESKLGDHSFKNELDFAIKKVKEYLTSDEGLLGTDAKGRFKSKLKKEFLKKCQDLLDIDKITMPSRLLELFQECQLKYILARIDATSNDVTNVEQVKKIITTKFEKGVEYNADSMNRDLKGLLKINTSNTSKTKANENAKKYRQRVFGNKGSIKANRIALSPEQQEEIDSIIFNILNEGCSGETYVAMIQQHFGYSDLRTHFGYILLKKLGVTVCPYCNSQFVLPITGYKLEKKTITKARKTVRYKQKKWWQCSKQRVVEYESEQQDVLSFEETDRSKAYCQLDHFLPKSKYPYLCISLYNLIPSCSYCNLYKKDDESPLLNPYFYNIQEKFKFTTPLGKKEFSDFIKNKEIKEIDIRSTSEEYKKEINNHIEMFRLKGVYKNHIDYVNEIHMKAHIYNDSFRKELKKRTDELPFDIDDDDINRLILGNYTNEEDLNKRPLAKLTKDIAEELGLI